MANRLRRRTSDQTVLGSNPAVAAELSPWTSLFTPNVPRRSLFTLASLSYMAILVNYILAKKKKELWKMLKFGSSSRLLKNPTPPPPPPLDRKHRPGIRVTIAKERLRVHTIPLRGGAKAARRQRTLWPGHICFCHFFDFFSLKSYWMSETMVYDKVQWSL